MEPDFEQPRPALFQPRPPQPPAAPVLPWAIAGAAVVAVLIALIIIGHRKPAETNVILPDDPYAASLVIGGLEMSESTSLSGGKSTYIDGHIRNAGDRMVTAATVQVLFANDEGMPPQIKTLPLSLIRTREPYVDTQPVSAAPLAPGDKREFRLIFEGIGSNWNQKIPVVHIVKTSAH